MKSFEPHLQERNEAINNILVLEELKEKYPDAKKLYEKERQKFLEENGQPYEEVAKEIKIAEQETAYSTRSNNIQQNKPKHKTFDSVDEENERLAPTRNAASRPRPDIPRYPPINPKNNKGKGRWER